MALRVETCKKNAIDPCACLRATVTAIANGLTAPRIGELMSRALATGDTLHRPAYPPDVSRPA
jgi:hypothetical protein